MASLLGDGGDHVWVGGALVDRDTIEGNDRVVRRVQDQSRDFYVLYFLQATSFVIVLRRA